MIDGYIDAVVDVIAADLRAGADLLASSDVSVEFAVSMVGKTCGEVQRALEEWDETKHPRNEKGQFGGSSVEVYHGTTPSYVEGILKDGLEVHRSGAIQRLHSKHGAVYVTSSEYEAYVWGKDTSDKEAYSKGHDSNPEDRAAILRVQIPLHEAVNLRRDENLLKSSKTSLAFSGSIKSEWITGVKFGGRYDIRQQEWQKPSDIRGLEAATKTIYVVVVPNVKVRAAEEAGHEFHGNQWTSGAHAVKSGEKIDFKDDRSFMFNPKTNALVLGRIDVHGNLTHGDSLLHAGLPSNGRAYDSYLVRGYFRNGGIKVTFLMNVRDQAKMSDDLHNLYDKMRAHGATDETKVDTGYGWQPLGRQSRGLQRFLDTHSYCSTQINLPEPLRSDVLAFSINEEDIVKRELNPHVTVRYGLTDVSATDVARVLAGVGPVRVVLGLVSVFEADPSQTAPPTVTMLTSTYQRDASESRWASLNVTDRYQALGIPYPNPKTICQGQCEGTGWVPVYHSIGDKDRSVYPEDETDQQLFDAWLEAEEENPTDDGWHFVRCPACNGTGLRGLLRRMLSAGNGLTEDVIRRYLQVRQLQGDIDVLKIDVHSPDLHRLNTLLKQLPHVDTHPTYQPHVTLAYVKPGRGAYYAGIGTFAGREFMVDRLVFTDRDENETTIELMPRLLREWNEDDHPRDSHGQWSTSGETHDARRAALKIPPAWTDVKINTDPNADLQATGTDSKGRTQYRYSAEHSETAAAEKFARLKEFSKELPSIREKVAADLKDGTPEQKEAAAVLTLIDRTGFRIGSERETGAEKDAYGASTLLSDHVTIDGDKITFNFVGKKGVDIEKTVTDRQLASLLAPRVAAGGKLFNTSDDKVRDYLHSRDGDFKVKDFRTYHGTTEALKTMQSMPIPKTAKDYEKARKEVGKVVASHLGNTPAVALTSYIDPAVFGKWKSKLEKGLR